MTLARTRQQDFSAGAVRSTAKHRISSRGTYDVENGLHDDDGAIYRRGRAQEMSSTAPASSFGRFLWDGTVGPGLQRTVRGGLSGIAVLAADDFTSNVIASNVVSGLGKHTVIDSMLFIPRDATFAWLYGGSRRTSADFSAGTVSVTNGSRIVTGAGTAWNGASPVEPGDLFIIDTAARLRVYVVESVQSNTQITLMQPVEEPTAAGLAYRIQTVASCEEHGPAPTGGPTSGIVTTHENRLVWLEDESTIRFSPGLDPDTGHYRSHRRNETDFHKVPEGVEVITFESLRDRLLVFTSAGAYAITNMAFDLVDGEGNVQQRMEKISDDVVAWGPGGVCAYKGALIVPALDNIYVMDGISPPVALADQWASYIREQTRAAAKPGTAVVHNGHLLLPLVTGDAAAYAVTETWVVRLARPVQTGKGLAFAWSRFTGAGGQNFGYARRARAGEETLLLAVSAFDGSKLADCSTFFTPGEGPDEVDYDLTLVQPYEWAVETREWMPGDGAPAMVRTARILYELDDAFTAPEITLSVAVDGSHVFEAVAGTNAGSDAEDPMAWHAWAVDRRARQIRFRLECATSCKRLVLRELDFWARVPGNTRRGS